jgi:hypothetical protein
MSEPKLIRITMEFDNGKIQWLEGKEAHKWLEACNNQAVMEHIHGRSFPEFKWKVKANG